MRSKIAEVMAASLVAAIFGTIAVFAFASAVDRSECRAQCFAAGDLEWRVEGDRCFCRMPCMLPWRAAGEERTPGKCQPCTEGQPVVGDGTTHVEVLP